MDAANITPTEISIQFDLNAKSVEVTVKTDFEVLSAGVLDPFMGTFELVGRTVMRYEG